ncbi:MAG: sulfur carrier protein ThiS [bacterium]
MKIFVNGNEHELEGSSITVEDVIKTVNMPSMGLVAELDGEIISNKDFSKSLIKDNSKLELIRIVGGG